MEKQLRKNLFYNTFGSLLFYICQASMNLLVTAIAGIAANGLLATAMTISNVSLSMAAFGMRTFQVSDLDGKYTDRTYLFSRYATLALAFWGCMSFAFANAYSSEQRWVILLYTGYRLIESWSDVWHGYLQRAERMDIVGISFGARGLLTALVMVVGLLLTHSLVPTLAVLLVLNALYVLLVDIPMARKVADFTKRGGPSVAALLLECAPLAIYASLNTAIPSVPRYFCERISGEVELSYFANLFLPVMLLQVAVIYLFVPFITTFARLWNDRNRTSFYKGLGFLGIALLVVWGAGALGCALLGRWGLSVLYPTTPEILNYTGLLQPLVLATVLTIMATVLCNLLTIARCMAGLITSSIVGLGIALLVSPPLIDMYGIWGTAWSTIAGIAAQALCLLLFLFYECKQQFN